MLTHVRKHVRARLFPVSAVPDSTLLSASGVLERLAGRFNIQLAGSRSSYITAENAAPSPHLPHLPAIALIPWLFSRPPPPPSLWSQTALQTSVCPSAFPLIAFDLNGLFFIWRLLPTLPPPPHNPLHTHTPHPSLLFIPPGCQENGCTGRVREGRKEVGGAQRD